MSKRRDLSLREKNNLIKVYDSLPKCSQREAASKLQISQATLCNLLRKRTEITEKISRNENGARKRKRESKCSNVDAALWKWYESAKLLGIPISRATLMEKSLSFAIQLGEHFVPTDGWISRWKERHNVANRKQQAEQKEPDHDAVSLWWNEVLPEILKDFKPNQIYNTDETALYYRALPENTVEIKSESPTDDKKTKQQQLTVLLTCNQDGSDKKTPLVIGPSKTPRCLKGVKNLPVNYFHTKNAWMTTEIFSDFLLRWDRELGNKKIALLLDNCSAHKRVFLTNIKLVFLPSDSTTILQPLSQGITTAFKSHYRKDIMKKVVEVDDIGAAGPSSKKIAKPINLLDSFHMINKAWASVNERTIQNAFIRSGVFQRNYEEVFITGLLPDPEEQNALFLKYVAIDDNLTTTAEDDNIVEEVKAQEVEYEDMESGSGADSDSVVQTAPTASEAQDALQIIRRTLEMGGDSPESYREFYKLENIIENILLKNTKQSTTSD